jgi:hypothetical protein
MVISSLCLISVEGVIRGLRWLHQPQGGRTPLISYGRSFRPLIRRATSGWEGGGVSDVCTYVRTDRFTESVYLLFPFSLSPFGHQPEGGWSPLISSYMDVHSTHPRRGRYGRTDGRNEHPYVMRWEGFDPFGLGADAQKHNLCNIFQPKMANFGMFAASNVYIFMKKSNMRYIIIVIKPLLEM